ncbi:MAG: LD-carboxypeptidase [Bdellovibrionota bacterium]
MPQQPGKEQKNKLPTIRIIRPSSREKDSSLIGKIDTLASFGFPIKFDNLTKDGGQDWEANSLTTRVHELNQAFLEPDSDIVFCARGGYGASDLLPLIAWEKLKGSKEKPIIGFSDISAILSGCYTKLGWNGIHGPMPITDLWNTNGSSDVHMLFEYLTKKQNSFKIPINPFQSNRIDHIEGWMFGGCFSVLTNLIATPYFPTSLAGAILFFEDVSEAPARILRYLNQWIQCGCLSQVKGIILGRFFDNDEAGEQNQIILHKEFLQRTNLPIFTSNAFGHVSPNLPIRIGAQASVESEWLIWHS